MAHAEITIHPDRVIGKVNPQLHGHFVEQLFGSVNGGLHDPKTGQFRPEFIEKGAELGLELIRWPGGCFADAYNWRDGIGNNRPKTVTNRWGADEIETHAVGSHEFLDFCKRTNAKAWINLNVATGTPREAAEWMEYLTFAGDTDLAKERGKNGHPEPYAVELWGIGNECWDCGGKFIPSQYAHQYRQFESALPRFKGVPRRLVIGGPDGNKPNEREVWTREVLAGIYNWRPAAAHALDMHFYTWGDTQGTGTSNKFDANQYMAMLWRALEIEPVILKQREILNEFDPKLALYVGEWGPWHSDAFGNDFWQHNTIRDGLIACLTLDIFHRHADKLSAATYTMLCNVLGAPFQTVDGHPYVTPVYHAFVLNKPHRGGESLSITAAANRLSFPFGTQKLDLPGISASVTRHSDGLYLTATNLSPAADCTADVRMEKVKLTPVNARVLASDELTRSNSPGAPEAIALKKGDVTATANGGVTLHIPPAATLGVHLKLG